MKKLFFSVLSFAILTSISAHAIDVYQYKQDQNGKKTFSRKWNGQGGEITFQVESARRSTTIPNGTYDLSKATGGNVFQLYHGLCTVKFTGTMTFSDTGITSTPIKMSLLGEGCQQFYELFPFKTAHLPLFGVPSVDGSSSVSITIHISNLAVTDCGLEGSLVERQANCASRNGQIVTRTVPTLKGKSNWTLVSFSDTQGSAWKDNVTGLVWGPPSKTVATLSEAKDSCSQDVLLKYLPTEKQFSAASDHGVFGIFPKAGVYWAPESRTSTQDQEFAYGTQTSNDLDNPFGMSELVAPSRKIYFHCVSK